MKFYKKLANTELTTSDFVYLKYLVFRELDNLKSTNLPEDDPEVQQISSILYKLEHYGRGPIVDTDQLNSMEERIAELERQVEALNYVTDVSDYYE